MRLAEQLKYYREMSGYTQESLAKQLDVTRQSISKWETGACFPDIRTLVKLSELYDVSLDEIVKGRRFFNIPFDVSSAWTRKRLFRHFFLHCLCFIVASIVLSTLFVTVVPLTYSAVFGYSMLTFALSYLFFFFPFSQSFTHWQIQKSCFLVYDTRYTNQLKSLFLIIFSGNNFSLYTSIPYDQVDYCTVVYQKRPINYTIKHAIRLTPNETGFFTKTNPDPFYFKIKTNQNVYYLDLTNDYVKRLGNTYFFLPEIKEWFDLKGVEFRDPQAFVEHSKQGKLVYDFIYAKEDQKSRAFSNKQ